MPYRIELLYEDGGLRIVFCGLLDSPALEALRASVRQARARGSPEPTIVLGPGTDLDPGTVAALRDLEGARVVATSPFLARWIAGA